MNFKEKLCYVAKVAYNIYPDVYYIQPKEQEQRQEQQQEQRQEQQQEQQQEQRQEQQQEQREYYNYHNMNEQVMHNSQYGQPNPYPMNYIQNQTINLIVDETGRHMICDNGRLFQIVHTMPINLTIYGAHYNHYR